MLFNSYQFLIFFPLVTLAYFLLPPKFLKLNEAVTIKIKNLWLLICSYYFYMCWNAKYVILLMTATGITFLGGLAISKIQKTTGKKAILALCIALNMFILFFYKYANFVIELLNGLLSSINFELSVRQFDVLLPVGISFYTFQALSYVIDVYRDEVKVEKNFFTYALFVSFFPQLVAGPIERSKNLLTQFSSNKGYMCLHEFEGTRVTKGLQLMLYGFFEKLVVADRLSVIVTNVYSDYTNFAGIQIVLATVMFAFQIYCDFSGYSHIAIGASEILGFKLMKNFRQPYFAVSVTDFWHRWHVSLTTWFKDYLYIPLGGNKKHWAFNMLIVWALTGFWHGAAWNFILWGLYYFVFLMVEK
ncbi:MAG: MBOAT family O-acyltransferase, partial [Oscillospiraceae bacterium]